MSLAFDETGRPFIILREQQKKKRVKGLEAHKVSLTAECIRKLSNRLNSITRLKRLIKRIALLFAMPLFTFCSVN